MRTMKEFAPDPGGARGTDEQVEEERVRANVGGGKGIELRGDGRGAGSGEEIKS